MKPYLVLALAAVASALAAPAAMASASSSISVTDFRVQVTALAPGDVPAVSFDGAGGSSAESASSSAGRSPDQQTTLASGCAFGVVASTALASPFAGGSAAMVGDVFGAGASATTSAFARSDVPASHGEGTLGLVNDVGAASFTLAPWTRMTISANVSAVASSDGANPDEFAESGLLMAIGDDTGLGPQWDYVDFNALALGAFGAFTDTEATFVMLAYDNDSDAPITGLFSGYIASDASSGAPLSAVPEPGAAAMLVIGLAATALFRARQRKRPA